MKPRRVVITGIGAFTPVGHRRGRALGRGPGQPVRGALHRPLRPEPIPLAQVAAQIDDFHPADHLDARRARRLDRFSALTVAGGRSAVDTRASRRPAIEPASTWGRRSAASRCGGAARGVRGARRAGRRAHPCPRRVRGAGASNVAIDLEITGPTLGNANPAHPVRWRSARRSHVSATGSSMSCWPGARRLRWRRSPSGRSP